MFDSKQPLTERLSDAIDLAIDLATLGEYGLEPVGRARQGCDGTRPRAMPIADRETFTEVLFPNQCSARSRNVEIASTRGPRRQMSRRRGGRGASGAFRAGGAA